jgi:hypothetical protein
MIQAIKLNVNGENGTERELCLDLEEDVVSIYLGDIFICSLDYTNNFKEGIKKIIETW